MIASAVPRISQEKPPPILRGIAVVLATVAVVAAIRWAGPPIYDGDGWYHVKYASILLHDGIARTFPWFQESFLKDRFRVLVYT